MMRSWRLTNLEADRGGTVIVLVMIVLLAAPSAHGGDRAGRPNIVLIISDDQTYTDFGFMGHRQVQTPHLDRLAADAARYVNGYVPTSVCRPSLVTLLTGRYPHEHGIYFNHPPPGFRKLTTSVEIDKSRYDALRERAARQIREIPTLPRLLAAEGYRCLQTGKYWEGHWRNAGFTAGMTTAAPSGGTHGDKTLPNGDVVAHGNGDHGLAIGRETMEPIVEMITSNDPQPFFLWYAPFLPHTPHDSPQAFLDRYRGSDVPPHCLPYYAAITQFDETVGQLVALIERQGLADNTLFAFVTDNGWTPDASRYVASRGEWDHTPRSKRAPFEHGLRTPILLRWDGVIAPGTHTAPVSSVDLVPTLLAAGGVDLQPLNLPGESLLSSATGQTALDTLRPVFGEIYPGDASQLENPAADIAYRWVRRGRHKLIVPHSHEGRPPWKNFLSAPALFDVVADPQESQNQIEQQPEVAGQLRQLLNDWWTPGADL